MAEDLISLDYRKWYTNEIELLDKALSPEQAWLVVTSVHRYSAYGTEPDVPPELSLFVRGMCLEVDNARKKYQKRCEVNRENGKKGGEAKARNAKAKSEAEPETADGTEGIQSQNKELLTFEEFSAMADSVEQEPYAEYTISEKQRDEIYDTLRERNWKLCGLNLVGDAGRSVVNQYLYSIACGVMEDCTMFIEMFEGCFNTKGVSKAGVVARNLNRWAISDFKGIPIPSGEEYPFKLLNALKASDVVISQTWWIWGDGWTSWLKKLPGPLMRAVQAEYRNTVRPL